MISIHFTMSPGTSTATAGDILTSPRCLTTASTATVDDSDNVPVIYAPTMTFTVLSTSINVDIAPLMRYLPIM